MEDNSLDIRKDDSLEVRENNLEIKNENDFNFDDNNNKRNKNKKNNKNSKKFFGLGLGLGLGLGIGLTAAVAVIVSGFGISKALNASQQQVNASVYGYGDYNYGYDYGYDDYGYDDSFGSYYTDTDYFEEDFKNFKALSFEEQKASLTEYLNVIITDSIKYSDKELEEFYKEQLNAVNSSSTSDELVNLVSDNGGALLTELYDYEYGKEQDAELRQQFVSMTFEEQKSILTQYLNDSINDSGYYGDSQEIIDEYKQHLEAVNSATTSEQLIGLIDSSRYLLGSVYYSDSYSDSFFNFDGTEDSEIFPFDGYEDTRVPTEQQQSQTI